jgi:hypothetical protein
VRFGGEELATPIPVAPSGRIPFAVSVLSGKECRIMSTSVEFDPAQVDLQAKGAQEEPSTDQIFPIALDFEGNRAIRRGILAGHFFDYNAKSDSFTVRFVATVVPEGAEIPFPISMFAPRVQRIERTVLFRIAKDANMGIKSYGLMIKPGEGLQVVGAQAQEAVSCATREGKAQVRVITGDQRR